MTLSLTWVGTVLIKSDHKLNPPLPRHTMVCQNCAKYALLPWKYHLLVAGLYIAVIPRMLCSCVYWVVTSPYRLIVLLKERWMLGKKKQQPNAEDSTG